MKNSAVSQNSRQVLTAALALCVLATISVLWFYRHGYTLYYGDAQAHLDISRSLIDSRTPGYDQIGTVWLPLLHVICLPLVGNMFLWSTGLAGAIPVAACFVIAGSAFFAAARHAYGQEAAAWIVLACFALNPNVLYLASIPMTEMVFLAGVAFELLAIVRYRKTQRKRDIFVGIVASWCMSLTRYDGWFLIPFIAIFFAAVSQRSKLATVIAVGSACTVAPLYWLGHCWCETGNALDFFNGPYSAKAIQGNKPYPGLHDWTAAIHYYFDAGRLCAGWPLVLLGAAGIGVAIKNKKAIGVAFLWLTPIFYVWSVHSSGTPIFVPGLWPHGYYNTRYGIAVVALCAFACGALSIKPRVWLAAVPLLCISPWLLHPSHENWICWKESERNSIDRRAWTNATAAFLETNRTPGESVLAPFGDLTGIFCRAHIPLREVLHEGDNVAWLANTTRPDLLHQCQWAIMENGSPLYARISTSGAYTLQAQVHAGQSRPIDIFKRTK